MGAGYSREALGLAESMGHVVERNRLKLAAARVFDGQLAAKRGELKGFGRSGRLSRQISVCAVMNAVHTEGRDVLTNDAEGYWKDQDRRYFGIQDGARSVTAMRNRLGRVTFRKVYYADGRQTTEDRRQTPDPAERGASDGFIPRRAGRRTGGDGRRTTEKSAAGARRLQGVRREKTDGGEHTSMQNKNIAIMVI